MSTTTEATEGQAKIREALERMQKKIREENLNDGGYRLSLEEAVDEALSLLSSPPIVGEPNEAIFSGWIDGGQERGTQTVVVKLRRQDAAKVAIPVDIYRTKPAAQAPQSSPAPRVKPDGIMNEGYIEATRAHGSPAPSVIEAGDAMLARLHHSSPKCISGEKCVCGLAAIYERWDAAKASRPSVTAPKHMNLEDEARVWWDERYGGLNPDTTSATHERKMLAAFASHVLSLSPAAQGVMVDQILEVVKRVRPITDECPRCDGMGCSGDVCPPRYWEQPMRNELSALLTK